MFAALAIILLVAGAILAFAVDRQADGVDLVAIGWILMAGGGLALLVAMVRGASFLSTPSKAHTERHLSSDGQHYVEETETA
jgi:Domain of unknown function (DUF6458)